MTRLTCASILAGFGWQWRGKLTNNTHSALHIVGAHCTCLIKNWKELNVSWTALRINPFLKTGNSVVSVPLFQIVGSNKTFKLWRQFWRLGERKFESREYSIYVVGSEQMDLLMTEISKQWPIKWIWGLHQDEAKGWPVTVQTRDFSRERHICHFISTVYPS